MVKHTQTLFFLTFSYLIDFQKITARLFSLFGYDFISVDTQSKLKIHDIPTYAQDDI